MKRLEKIAFVLRKEETDFLELTEAIDDYEALVFELSNISIAEESNRRDIHFVNGKALGTTWAALCIRDILRTKTFIKGLFNAIDYVKETKEGPVHVIYAGTGPFATLILPIMATYPEEKVQFTLLEINKVSFESTNRVINKLGFDRYIKGMVNEDATKYVVNPDDQIDILVSETMQRALEREQQVPIVMNIMRQLKADSILIPEKITLDLCLMNMTKFQAGLMNTEEESCIIKLGHIFELSREKIIAYYLANQTDNRQLRFPRLSFDLPIEQMDEFNQLVILTEIQVFGEDRIGFNESGLTTPLILEDLSGQQEELTVNIRYCVNEDPGIEYQLIQE